MCIKKKIVLKNDNCICNSSSSQFLFKVCDFITKNYESIFHLGFPIYCTAVLYQYILIHRNLVLLLNQYILFCNELINILNPICYWYMFMGDYSYPYQEDVKLCTNGFPKSL